MSANPIPAATTASTAQPKPRVAIRPGAIGTVAKTAKPVGRLARKAARAHAFILLKRQARERNAAR